MSLRTRVRQAVSPVLFLLGLVLLVYVAFQYGHMYLEQRRLAHEWERQQQARQNEPQQASESNSDDEGLTRIFAPKIDLDSVVVEGTSSKALLLGPGHMTDTPAPGQAGNVVITAHRDTFFRHIHELQKGDTVVVQRDGKTFRYEVTGKKIVEPSDVSVLQPTKDSRMTLITCYPTYYIGPAPKRLVVVSKLVDDRGQEQPQPRSAAAHAGGQ